MRHKWKWIVSLVLVVGVTVTYVNYKYYFNPFTFQQDTITYLPWSWYKNPMQIEYGISGANQWKMTKVQDKSEIDFVISELKKGSQLGYTRPLINEPTDKPMIIVTLRELQDGPNSPGIVLIHAQGYTESDVIRTGQAMQPIQLTGNLKALIEKRINEAK